MNLNRIFKTIFLTEFFLQSLKRLEKYLNLRKPLTTLLKKAILAQDLEESMH